MSSGASGSKWAVEEFGPGSIQRCACQSCSEPEPSRIRVVQGGGSDRHRLYHRRNAGGSSKLGTAGHRGALRGHRPGRNARGSSKRSSDDVISAQNNTATDERRSMIVALLMSLWPHRAFIARAGRARAERACAGRGRFYPRTRIGASGDFRLWVSYRRAGQ